MCVKQIKFILSREIKYLKYLIPTSILLFIENIRFIMLEYNTSNTFPYTISENNKYLFKF